MLRKVKKPFFYINPYFLFPAIAFWIAGAFTIAIFDKTSLFLEINGHYSVLADRLMYYLTFLGQAEVIISVLAFLFVFRQFRNIRYFVSALLCNFLPFLVQQLLKSMFNFDRPMNVLQGSGRMVHYLSDWPLLYHRSFPSGHTAGAFSFFCFLSLIVPIKYRNAGLLFFLLALSVGYSRIYLAAHFFNDIYFGSIVGTVLTIVIFAILKKFSLTPNPGPEK